MGRVTLNSKSVAVGVGANWREGVLTFQGKGYPPLSISGLSLVDVGVANSTGAGKVYDMKGWALIDGSNKKPLTVKKSRLTRQTKEPSTDGAVAALSEAVADLSREISDAARDIDGRKK